MKLQTISALRTAAAAALFVLAGAASAAPIELVLNPVDGRLGPQSASNPCVIAGTNCKMPAGMGYNDFKSDGNTSSYNMYSTTPTDTLADGVKGDAYTVAQLRQFVGDYFIIAIDVNTTAEAGETLQNFYVYLNGDYANPLYSYTQGPTNIGIISNNGNGYADWYLSFVNLSLLQPTDTILFHAYWTGASDGAESFFLIRTDCANCAPEIPEPGTLALIGLALTGLGFARRRRV